MPSLRETMRTLLSSDATLSGILTGGVYDSDQLDRGGIDKSAIRDTNLRLKPFAVIRWRASNPYAPREVNAEQRFFEVWLYEDGGTESIESAKARTKTLLHRKYFNSVDDTGLVYTEWAGDLGEIPPGEAGKEFGNSSADRSRFMVIFTRQ